MNNLYYIPNGSLGFPKAASEIVGNPLFVNLTAGNYQLQATSPAIDKGVRLSYTRDFLNRPVPVGPAPDMGATKTNKTCAGIAAFFSSASDCHESLL